MASLVAQSEAVQANVGTELSGTVARITDQYPLLQREDLRVQISWGDGTETSGGITRTGTGHFDVTGHHTYASPGMYSVRVKVTDVYGRSAKTTSTAAILPAA